MRFILGPLVILLGLAMMRYTVQITEFTGRLDFAEKYLGGGMLAGTYSWWRLVGLVFMILGAFWIFGLLGVIGNVLVGVFSLGGK